MHPVLSHGTRLRWYFTAWALAGLSLGLIVRGLVDGAWLAAVAFGLPMGLLAGSISLSGRDVCRALPISRTPAARLVATATLAAVITAAVWSAAGELWWRALASFGVAGGPSVPPGLYPLLLMTGGLTYLLAVTMHYVWQAFEDAAAASRRVLEAQVAHRDAELRALRAQVDPHFLFNSLNAIAGLVGPDPATARQMCQRLADFLRDSLSLSRTDRIPLGREVALARQYLDVEQVRFGSRLTVEADVEDDAAGVPVPPLLLQPLVENAVRHGIAMLVEGGTIAIRARRAGARAVVVVSNPRDADRPVRGTGFGLDIVRRRLDAAFPNRASLVVEQAPAAFHVSLTIPIEQ